MARGLAGAALFAVPVAVAALIGFGSGFAGVAGGLSSVTNGPEAAPVAAQTGPAKLNRAVVALANRSQTQSNGSSPTGSAGGGATGGSTGTGATTGTTGTSGTSGSSGGSGGSQTTINTPTVPSVSLPGTDSGGTVGSTVDGATNVVNGTVDNLLGGVNNTLNGLLGK